MAKILSSVAGRILANRHIWNFPTKFTGKKLVPPNDELISKSSTQLKRGSVQSSKPHHGCQKCNYTTQPIAIIHQNIIEIRYGYSKSTNLTHPQNGTSTNLWYYIQLSCPNTALWSEISEQSSYRNLDDWKTKRGQRLNHLCPRDSQICLLRYYLSWMMGLKAAGSAVVSWSFLFFL